MYTQSSLFLKNQRKNNSTKKPNFDLLSPGDYYEKCLLTLLILNL